MTKTVKVEGMTCEHCSHKVKTALEEIAGVTRAEVKLDSQTAEVELSSEVGRERFSAAIDQAGYTFVSVG